MSKYEQSAIEAEKFLRNYIKKRMDERDMNVADLSRESGVGESSIHRWLSGKFDTIKYRTLMKICGALELRPYYIPAEIDENEMKRIFFN